jgi:hypothetical protein
MSRAVTLYDTIRKQRIEVPYEEADRMLRDPAYLVMDDQEFTLVDPWGQKFGAVGKEVYKHLDQEGFRLETQEEEHQRYLDENYGGVGGAAAAGVLGAARGLTLGLTDVGANAAGYGDLIADLAEAHPGISGTTEVLGAVGGVLGTGGTGGAARASTLVGRTAAGAARLAPATLAVKGGNAAAHAVEAALRSGAAMDKGAVLLGKASGMAAEGAMFGGGAAVSEALLGDPDAAASDILADWAAGSAEGAALGGVLGFAFGLPALRRKADKILSSADVPSTAGSTDEGLRAMLSEVTGRDISPEALSLWQQTRVKVNTAIAKMKHGRANPEQIKTLERLVNDPLERTAALLDEPLQKGGDYFIGRFEKANRLLRDALDEGTAAAGKRSRVARIAKDVPDMSNAAAISRYALPVGKFRSSISAAVEEAEAYGHTTVRNKLQGLYTELETIGNKAADGMATRGTGRGGEVALEALDEAGELINRRIGEFKRLAQFRENDTYIKTLEAARKDMFHAFGNTSFFGTAANKMMELREAANGTLKHQKGFLKALTRKGKPDKLGRVSYDLDVKKARTWLADLARDPDTSLDVRNVREYLQGAKRQLETNKRLGAVADEQLAKYAEAEAALDDLIDGFVQWQKVAKAKADYRALSKLSGFEGLKGANGIFKQAGGLGLLGMAEGVGAGASSGMFMLGSALGTMQRPAQLIQDLHQLHGSRMRMSETIRKSVRGMLGAGKGKGGRALGVASASLVGGRGRPTEDINTILDGLGEVVAAGPAANEPLQVGFGSLRGMAPATTAAMAKTQQRGAEYLVRKAGQLGVMKRPGSFRAPSTKARDQFWKVFGQVNDPVTNILGPMSRGYVDADAMEVLSAVYPSLLEGVKSAAWEELTEAPFVGASTAKRLSRILGIPHPDAIAPDTVRVLQNAQRVLNPSGNPATGGSGRPTADTTLTAAQRLESK